MRIEVIKYMRTYFKCFSSTILNEMSSYRNNSRSYNDTNTFSPSSSSIHRKYPPNNHTIVLLSKSHDLAQQLSEVINSVAHNVEDLPTDSDLKAVILDDEYLKLVDLSWIRRAYPTSFIAVYDPSGYDKPALRSSCFEAGANMVAYDLESLLYTLKSAVVPAGSHGGKLTCPYCSLHNLTETELWYHCPAYHINWPNEVFVTNQCPICQETFHGPLQVHIHENHGKNYNTNRNTTTVTQLYNFALVICRHPITGKYLLCQEFANQGFWCPGGAVDAGEILTRAAVRETLEEAGIEVELKGILGIEYNPCGTHWRNNNQIVRLRVIFYAEPSASKGMQQLPKSSPDFESAGACWCSYEEIQSIIKLRGSEPKKWTRYLEDNNPIFPLSLLVEKEG